jgi:four helix bundle protein
MKENNPLVDNSKKFAVSIIGLCESIKGKQAITGQLIRSGTSIGANIHEANYAQSKNDFIAKLEVALKECYETEYWLELLLETKTITESIYKEYQQKAGVIRRLLIASCKTAKENK